MPAVAQKTSPELSGDVGVDGVIVNEWVGKGEEEPSVAFRLTLRSENLRRECAVACAVGGEVHIAQEKLFFGVCRELFGDQLWQTPVSQPFCLYIVVPEGYKPEGACKAGLSMLHRGMAISHEAGEYEAECERSGEALKMDARARLTGMVKVTASLPLKSRQACGDGAFAVACDCFEVDQIIGYTRGSGAFKLRDVAICPGRCHPDLTLLNARHGKSVYRLDGEMTIHCKRCPSRPLE